MFQTFLTTRAPSKRHRDKRTHLANEGGFVIQLKLHLDLAFMRRGVVNHSLHEHLIMQMSKAGDDRIALVLIAIGVAIAGFGLIQGAENAIRMTLGAALFPLLVGVALLVNRMLQKRALAGEQAAERG